MWTGVLPMNAFAQACKVEEASWKVLKPYLMSWAQDGMVVTTGKGRLSRELQKQYGDVFLNSRRTGQLLAIELKAERIGRETLFLETYSNRPRGTVGWMKTLNADWLLYHFLDRNELICIDFQKLKRWFWQDDTYTRFRDVKQSGYNQLNETWGKSVPIREIPFAIRMNLEEFGHVS